MKSINRCSIVDHLVSAFVLLVRLAFGLDILLYDTLLCQEIEF